MTKFYVVFGTRRTTANFSYFLLELNAVAAFFSLNTFLEPLAYPTDPRHSRISLVNYRVIFYVVVVVA